jgi:hypothetical protein
MAGTLTLFGRFVKMSVVVGLSCKFFSSCSTGFNNTFREKNYWWVRSFYSYNKDQAEKGDVKRRRVFFTHLPLELLPKSALNGDCRIVYVARNPKDNAVSFYHYHRMTRFLGLQHNLSWDEFFALYMAGSCKLLNCLLCLVNSIYFSVRWILV